MPQPPLPISTRGVGPRLVFLWAFAAAAALSISAVAATNFLVDPFQFFRKATPPQFSALMMRHQMPGIVRNYPFDAAIVGNSLGANLRPRMFEGAEPPLHVQNLTMLAGTLNETSIIARLALRKKSIKTMFWMIGNQNNASDFRFTDFPSCLYSPALEKLPLCYLVNAGIFRESLAGLLKTSELSRAGWVSYPDFQSYGHLPVELHDHACSLQRFIGSPDRIAALTDGLAVNLKPAWPDPSGRLQRLVLDVVDAHPEVHFVFAFSPVFITEFWKIAAGINTEFWQPSGQAGLQEGMKQELLKRSNVEVYDFQLASDVTVDPEQYRDLYHISEQVAGQMAHAMVTHDPRYRVTDLRANQLALQQELLRAKERLQSYFSEHCN